MTIVVSVRVTDGIVLATDSATTLSDQAGTVVKVYDNANKLFNLVKRWPIGAMTFGSGSIGSASISTLTKDLRQLLDNGTSDDPTYVLDPAQYTVRDVAIKAQRFFIERYRQAYPNGLANFSMGYIVCGYSSGATEAEAWQFYVTGPDANPIVDLYAGGAFGPRWQGMTDALDRLILGVSSKLVPSLIANGLSEPHAWAAYNSMVRETAATLFYPAMPIQDALELAVYLVDTAAKFARFSPLAAGIGGPIDVAAITKHEGFRWTKRKLFYSQELNN